MAALRRRPSRRSLTAIVLTIAMAAGLGALTSEPAQAAGPWFVAPPTASPAGANTATCGLSAATPCATVAFTIAKAAFVNGDTINVAAGTYSDKPTFTAKGANVVGAGAATTIFTANNSGFAMGFAGPNTSPVTLTGLTLTGGNNPTGGALAQGSGIVTTNNVDLTGSKAALGGGAYVAQNATLTMNGGTVKDNTATGNATNLTGQGGGIYVVGKTSSAAAGKLFLNGTSFTNNVADGAATVAGGNGGAIFNAGTAVINGGTYTANRAVASSNANTRRGQGGAIMNGPNDLALLNAPSLDISNVTINGGLPSGQFNATSGGGIANAEGFGGPNSTLTATNVTFNGNVALVGGGLYTAGPATVNASAFTSNVGVLGGGVYASPMVNPASNTTLTVNGGSFTSNVAINGGGIVNARTLVVQGGTVFTGNQAVTNGGAVPNGWGGGIYNGPIAANDKPTATVTDATFDGGAASGGNAVIGGAIANVGNTGGAAGAVAGKLDVLRGTFSKNVAGAGGAVYTGGATTVTDSTFDQNQATSASGGYGGGLYATPFPASEPPHTVTVDNTDLTGNTSAFVGGGIALLNRTTLNLKNGSTVVGGTAVSGGGIYNAGALAVTASSVSDNDAGFQGGGIYDGSIVATDTPTLTLDGATIDGNTAASVGGGLLVANLASVTGTGGTLSGNSALGGGAVALSDKATGSFDGTDFVGNTATGSGGGAIANGGTLSLAHSLLSTNHAPKVGANTGLGGAILSGSTVAGASTKLTIVASTLSGNDADTGAALWALSSGSGATNVTSIDRSTISGNVSAANVGAIATLHPLSITNSTVTGNTATGGAKAGIAQSSAGLVRIAGTIVSGNANGGCTLPVTAANDGGYNLADAGDASCGFSPTRNDVAGNPQLGPLGDNGGDTPTHVPGPASPALDRIPVGTATTISDAVSGNAVVLCAAGAKDQREVARPQGAKCDIGAVEVAQVAPVVTGPNPVDLAVGVGAGTPGPTFTTSAATTPKATLSVTGTLPTGITFVDNGNGTGSLQGTPAAGTGGDYPVTVKATNEAGTGTFDTVIVVHQAPVLQGPASDTYTVGVAGGPNQFSMASGHPTAVLSTSSPLPTGVTFTPGPNGTGTIAGTPAVGTGGVYPIVIDATNGTAPDAHFSFTLTVREAPTIAGPASDTFTVGTAHTSPQLTTTGQPVPTLTSSVLPAGLSLDTSVPGKATITGTPANGTGGEYDVTVTASNGVSPDASTIVHLVILEAPEISGPATVRFVAGTASSAGYSADGYSPTNLQADLSEAGALPAGVTFTDNGNGTATLGGTATLASVGTYPITVKATNGVSPDATLSVTLEIAPPLSISSGTLAQAAVGTPYSASVIAVGGQPAYVFTLEPGSSLPAGLTLNPNGTITGTPTGPTGNQLFVVRVTDSAIPSQSVTKILAIPVVKGNTTLVANPILLTVTAPLGIKITLTHVSARLTAGAANVPLSGQTIVFSSGGIPMCSGVTNANGVAECSPGLVNTTTIVLNGSITATYSGNALWNGSSGSNSLIQLVT